MSNLSSRTYFSGVFHQVHSAVPPAGAKPPPKLVLDGEGDNNDNDDDKDGDDEPAPALVAVTNAAVSQNTAAASDSHAPTTTHAVPHANSGEGPWDTRGTALRQEGAAAVAGTGGVSGGAGSRSGNNTAPGTRPQSPSPGGGGGASTKSKDPDRCLHLALRYEQCFAHKLAYREMSSSRLWRRQHA